MLGSGPLLHHEQRPFQHLHNESVWYLHIVAPSPTDTAVVRTLGTWETALWPTVGSTLVVEQSVLLLDTEPRDVLLDGVHCLFARVSVVCLYGDTLGVVALGEDEDIAAIVYSANGQRKSMKRQRTLHLGRDL